jgi:hypothetical protein
MDAWVFLFISNSVFFVVESFSEVLCKNYFGTISFFIQFKSAHVSNKVIISVCKSSEKTKVIFMKYVLK